MISFDNKTYVTELLEVSLIIINFVLIRILPTLCNKNLSNMESLTRALGRNFVHGNLNHLLTNVYALFSLSRIESDIGSKKYVILTVLVLLLATMMEYVVSWYFPGLPCSVGYSAVLFGLSAYELVKTKSLNKNTIAALIYMVIYPTLQNRKASLLSHGFGAISGVLAYKLLE